MVKSKVNIKNKPQIKDSLGTNLFLGDIVLFTTSKNKYELSCGVFLNHFNNGSGWKMRLKFMLKRFGTNFLEVCDNTLIGGDGVTHGVVKVQNPSSKTHIPKVKRACELKKELLARGKIKPKKASKVAEETRDLRTSSFLSSLGAPRSLKK